MQASYGSSASQDLAVLGRRNCLRAHALFVAPCIEARASIDINSSSKRLDHVRVGQSAERGPNRAGLNFREGRDNEFDRGPLVRALSKKFEDVIAGRSARIVVGPTVSVPLGTRELRQGHSQLVLQMTHTCGDLFQIARCAPQRLRKLSAFIRHYRIAPCPHFCSAGPELTVMIASADVKSSFSG